MEFMVPPPLNRVRYSQGEEPGLVTPEPGMSVDDFVKSIVDQLKAEFAAKRKKFSKGVVVWRSMTKSEPWVKITDVLSYDEASELIRQISTKNPDPERRFSFEKPGERPGPRS